MKELLIVKYGELMLKGNNRPFFVNTLIRNIRNQLKDLGTFHIQKGQSLLFLRFDDQNALDEAAKRLIKVFGIVLYHRALEVEKDMEHIQRAAADYFHQQLHESNTFKLETRRSDKSFSYSSYEINTILGQYLSAAFPHLKVDVHQPEVTIYLNIRRRGAYLYSDNVRGAGGLPVGTAGKAMVLLSGGIDSPLAAWLIARRGVIPEAVHFHSYPYTSERSKNKVIELARQLSLFTGKFKLHVFPFTGIQEAIVEHCPQDQVTIIMRRLMMRCAEKMAGIQKAQALITGESIGQVASQTMESLNVTNAAVQLPVFRPLIGMDKEEIVSYAKAIGTYNISIQPYNDCCTIFVPKHPQTKPRLQSITASENRVDFEGYIEKAMADTETIELEPEYFSGTRKFTNQ